MLLYGKKYFHLFCVSLAQAPTQTHHFDFDSISVPAEDKGTSHKAAHVLGSRFRVAIDGTKQKRSRGSRAAPDREQIVSL